MKCWCREPGLLCNPNHLCHENECVPRCKEYPNVLNKYCWCTPSEFCNTTEYCKDSTCQPRPNITCNHLTYTGPDECTCGPNHDESQICEEGKMCVQNKCRDIPVCEFGPGVRVVTGQDCYCNVSNSLCQPGQICDESQSSCVWNCPNFPHKNNHHSCFCEVAESSYCQQYDLCSSEGCSPACPSVPHLTPDSGCYCGQQHCSPGDMCFSGTCWPNVQTCPESHTTVADPACYCPHSNTLCLKNTICNNHNGTNACTEPYQPCPQYPEVTTAEGCVCNNRSICSNGSLCDENGVCRPPMQCNNPYMDRSLNLESKV